MRRKFSKLLAGILSTALVFSSANNLVYAEEKSYVEAALEPDMGEAREESTEALLETVETELAKETTTSEESAETKTAEGQTGTIVIKTTEEVETDITTEEMTEEMTEEEIVKTETTTEEEEETKVTETETVETETTTEEEAETKVTETETVETETTTEEEAETKVTETETVETETTTEEEAETKVTETETVETETAMEEMAKTETAALLSEEEGKTSANGLLEVRIVAGVEIKNSQKFTVALTGESKDLEKTVTLSTLNADSQNAPEVTADFSKLEEGTYHLTVSGDGYETYSQTDIRIENKGYRLQLYVGKTPETDSADAPKPGLIVQDDKSNDAVADAIVAAIRKSDKTYDLNEDGEIDLLDLDYFTKFVREEKSAERQQATLETFTFVSADEIAAVVGNKTELEKGDLKTMLEGKSTVALKSAGDKISELSPVELSFDFSNNRSVPMERILLGSPRENVVESGKVIIVYEEGGEEQSTEVAFFASQIAAKNARQGANYAVSCDENGVVQVNLGGQVAVKSVTFRITKTSNESLNLAEISSVEFVNGMENKIPDPVVDIPTELKAAAGNKSFTLSWNKQNNVTAYEIEISSEGKTDYRRTTEYSAVAIKQFNKAEMHNGTDYKVRVRSLNGDWKSGFSDEILVTPKATKTPDRPDNVSLTGGYRYIQVKWGKVEDSDSYNLYYREDGAEAFTKITGIEKTSYQVEDLKDDTKYEAYVTATNELGEGAPSLTVSGKTLSGLDNVKLPEYKLINTSNGEGKLSNHIKSATLGGASMVDSPLDEESNSALGLFDNSSYSYLTRPDWDMGGAYPGGDKGVTVELDQVYDVGMITFAEPVDLGSYAYCTVQYWDGSGTKQKVANVTILQKTSGSRKYHLIKFKDAVKTSKLQIGVGRYNGALNKTTISEIRLYEYDSIEQDILNLYDDDLHISLKESVTEKTIQELQDRLDTKDTVSGEYHPEKELLQIELDNAKLLLETGGLGGVVQVNPNITSKKDSGISVGGLNAWQPLGVSAAAGEDIVVYVGNPGKKDGAATDLQLVFTQYYAENSSLSTAQSLKIGRNEITVPKISSTDSEKGGALYVQYNGNNDNDEYAVRVSGGTKFPVLNLYRVSDEQERTQKIAAYVEELKEYVADLESRHNEVHSGSQNENVAYAYNQRYCVLNTTDIVMNQMMLSIPASQALAGLGSGDQEKTLANSVKAMEDMLILFYQHKGLTDSFADGTESTVIVKNHLPYRYLNIRYMKMFAGAFMYAAGNHIGIEFPETRGMVNCVPVVSQENGKYVSGRYFGWGIAHEIGHEINQSAYAYAEVTNNYFAVLAQAKDANNSVRFQYPEVFKKVTSGATGYSDNVFTQLGLYWQLHLAYDRDYNYKTYGTYQEIFENLFFARVDSYARDTSLAPAPGGVALTLDGGRDQNLMRLASAAAERDLSEFFIRWGMTPNDATLAYIRQFEPEERAIYYVDDAARVYEIENGKDNAITGKNVVTAKVDAKDSEVTLKLSSTADSEVLQGYEIARIFIEQGKERREVCGFTQSDTFTDYAAFAANHTITYEVTAIDKFMNRSAVYRTDTVKIEGDGIQDKSSWTIETNMVSNDDSIEDATEEIPCEPTTAPASVRMIDNNKSTTFTGKSDSADPYIVLKLNRSTQVSALRYTLSGEGEAIADYKIEISGDGETYTEVKTGTFAPVSGSAMVYFENGKDPWVCTYDASFVKLTAVGQTGKELSVTELDLFGPSGDNVEFLSAEDGQSGIGVLESDYIYDTETGAKIPAGSIVFTGTYKGNPAYNVVVLYDAQGKIVGGENEAGELAAQQIILAPDPGDALLGETSEGIWIYWLEPDLGVSEGSLPDKVRAELYRVDNALTNEGQRMVSDTKFVTLPDTLSSIHINQ